MQTSQMWPAQALWGWPLPLFSCCTVLAHGEKRAAWLAWIWALGAEQALPDKQPQPLSWDRPFFAAAAGWEITYSGIICSASHVNFHGPSGSAKVQWLSGEGMAFSERRGLVRTSVCLLTRWTRLFGPAFGSRMPLDLTFSCGFRRQDLLDDLLMKPFGWTLYPLWSRVFCCPYLSGTTLAGCCDHILQQVWGHPHLPKLESSSP